MANFDNMKAAVESLSGGRCTVIFDDLGMPSIMVQFPKLKYSDLIDGATQDTHPAFIVNGVERECIYISKYINVVVGDRAYSLPQKDPRVYIDFDSSVRACTTKGNGWHLLTNAAWSALALWCRKNNTIPRGNTSFGGSHERPFERGCVTYRYQDGDIMRDGRTATGSGPVFWNHDYSDSGISDLCGNVWEWVSGLRLKDGEIQIVPYGNAMRRECNMSKTSTEWKALTQTGAIVDPGTANTFKYNGTAAGDSTMTNHHVGASVLDIKRDKPNYTGPSTEEYFGYAHNTFESLAAASGVTVPQVMKALGLFPVDSNLSGDGLWVRNYGEHLPLRGGYWPYGAAAGVFALLLSDPRSYAGRNVGFRAAFVSL